MTSRRARLAIAIAVSLASTCAALADADGHVNFFLGQKALDEGDWDPVDRQTEFGAVMSFGRDEWPIHIAADVLFSGKEETLFDAFTGLVDVTGATFEAGVGVRKIWGVKSFHPYVGGGIAIVAAALELSTPFEVVDETDAAIGPWIDGGVFWRLGSNFNIGLDVRWSTAEVDLDFGGGVVAQDLDAGGLHYGLLLGFGW